MTIVTGHIGPIHFSDLRLGRRVADLVDWRCPRMTEIELMRFVIGVVEDRIFTAHQVQPIDDVGCVFPALSSMHEITADAQREIGTFYELRSRATGRARGGQPSFQTVQFIHREDWAIAQDMIAAEVLRRQRSK